MHIGKFLNYIGKGHISTFAFAVFILSFAVNRLYYYPQVVWSCFKDCKNLPKFEHVYFCVLLSGLFVIHTVWFSMIVKSVQKSWKNKKIVDAQEGA